LNGPEEKKRGTWAREKDSRLEKKKTLAKGEKKTQQSIGTYPTSTSQGGKHPSGGEEDEPSCVRQGRGRALRETVFKSSRKEERCFLQWKESVLSGGKSVIHSRRKEEDESSTDEMTFSLCKER